MKGKQVLIIFLAAFIFNLLWEELHSVLYVSYQGGAITHLILLRAALFDTAVIALFAYVCFYSPLTKGEKRILGASQDLERPSSEAKGVQLRYGALPSATEGMFILVLLIFPILLEKWALLTGRWVYADAMPLVPILHVGLTPAIQLGVTGYVSVKIANFFQNKDGLSRARL